MYLPAEVCTVLSGQSSKAKLDPGQTQSMIGYAVRKPWDNAASIHQQGIQTVGLDANVNLLMVRRLIHCHNGHANPFSILLASQSLQGSSKYLVVFSMARRLSTRATNPLILALEAGTW
jgi:hypothetical protein